MYKIRKRRGSIKEKHLYKRRTFLKTSSSSTERSVLTESRDLIKSSASIKMRIFIKKALYQRGADRIHRTREVDMR